MKQLLFLLTVTILFTQCSKSDSDTEPEPKSGFILDVKKNEKLSTGEVVERSTDVGAVHVWKADGKTLQIKSSSDAITGYAWDANTNSSVKSDIADITDHLTKNVEPGKYFVFVILDNSVGVGRFAYSYTNFEVKKGEILRIKKVFTTHVVTGSYEEWNKPE